MTLSEIKTRLSISQVLAHYRLQADKNQRLQCPFHPDKTPSLQIYPQTNTYCCFSTNCTAGTGDVIDFIMRMEGQAASGSFGKAEAIQKAKTLLDFQTGLLPSNGKSKVTAQIPSRTESQTESSPDAKSQPETPPPYEKLFQVFRSNLAKSAQGRDYLKERSLSAEEVGFNAGGWPQMKHCIIYPLRDREGKIVSLYGRSVLNNSDQRHYYTKDRQGLYPQYPDPGTARLVLTESVIDAATLLAHWEKVQKACHTDASAGSAVEVLACYGTNGLTEEHKAALQSLRSLQEVILFFDGDAAGMEAVLKQGQALKALLPGVRISSVETPEGEDINSLLQSYLPGVGHGEKEIPPGGISHLLETRKVLAPGEEPGRLEGRPEGIHSGTHLKENPSQQQGETNKDLDTSQPDYLTWQSDGLRFTLLGGINLQQADRMRVTLRTAIVRGSRPDPMSERGGLVGENPQQSFRHSLDLYNDDQVEKYIRKACERLRLGSSQLGAALAELTGKLEDYRWQKTREREPPKPKKRQLSNAAKARGLDYLKAPRLMERTNEDIGRSGVVGEEVNRLLMYLVFTTRLFSKPLHIICLGASGSGKTWLQERIASLFPEEDKIELTTSSDNAFYYFETGSLSHKIVLIEDMDGIGHILYPIRELQSKTRISKSVPLKDSKGNLKTVTVTVEGPICLAGTTTKEKLYEDNADRCLLIYLDGSAGQLEAIMNYQRRLYGGRISRAEEEKYKEQLRDIQSLLRPVKVVNPYAEQLKIPGSVLKPLRTNDHYLGFIEAVTFYHQYQRETKSDPETRENGELAEPYIETTLEDIAWANKLLADVLLAKSDELSGACRKFFEQLKEKLAQDDSTGALPGKQSFYAKEVRAAFRMNPSNLKRYLVELSRYGYIKIAGGNRYRNGFEYEICDYAEYDQLKSQVHSLLDEMLIKLGGKPL